MDINMSTYTQEGLALWYHDIWVSKYTLGLMFPRGWGFPYSIGHSVSHLSR